MDDLKFQILGIVRDALPIAPARRAHFYADTPNINRYKLDIDRLIASGYLREDTGSDKLYITTPGDLAYEQEKSHRDAMEKYEWQLKALQEMVEAARADARAAENQAKALENKAEAARIQAKAVEAEAEAARIQANAVEKEAKIAEQQAISAEKDAAFARRQSQWANRIAVCSVILSLLDWLFTGEDVITFLSGFFG